MSGSIGYAVANFLVIPFAALDPTYAATFLTGALIYLTCMVIALVRVHEPPAKEGAPSQWGAWREVLAERNLVVLYVFMAVSAIGTSMGMQFMANHLDETFHLSKAWIGRVIGLAAVIEIPALILLGRAGVGSRYSCSHSSWEACGGCWSAWRRTWDGSPSPR